MKKYLVVLLAVGVVGCTTSPSREPQSLVSASPQHFETLSYDTGILSAGKIEFRTGYFEEMENAPFQGCVLFLEGLGDSVRNHVPLFWALSKNGFRVIYFDYMGQGGSSGTMNDSRVYDPVNFRLQLGTQAQLIWNSYATRQLGPHNLSCSQSKKMVIGWSTGGLVAYKMAHDGWADGVVLIAPGIEPKTFVGESAHAKEKLFLLQPVITERTLTRNTFSTVPDPHLDKIKPQSPLEVPLFASNLLVTSELSHGWKIPTSTKGIVFLSGPDDTYVRAEETRTDLNFSAPQFSIYGYDQALHEIDNEVPVIAEDFQKRTVDFLKGVSNSR